MDMSHPIDQGTTRNGHAYLRLGNTGRPLFVIDELNVRPRPVEGLTLQGMLQVYEAYLEHYQLIYLFRRASDKEAEEEEEEIGGDAFLGTEEAEDVSESASTGTEEAKGVSLGTEEADEELTIATEAESYMNAMFEFGYPPVHLLGISYGGLIAMEIGATAPQLLRSLAVALVGCEVAGGMRKELLRLATLAREGEWRLFHAGMANALHYHSSFRPLFAAIAWSAPRLLGIPKDPERVARMLEAFARAHLCERLKRISVPTLIVAGDQDPYVSEEILAKSVEELPQGELSLFEGAGHSLLRSRQEQVEKRIIAFFKAAEE